MSSYLDILPSSEREKIRTQLRSPEAYEKLRQRVKGPEDLAKEMERSKKLADVHFLMESEPKLKESLKQSVQEAMGQQGIEAVSDQLDVSQELQDALKEGRFDVAVEAHPDTHEDALVLLPEGNVQEKIPVSLSLSDKIITQTLSSNSY